MPPAAGVLLSPSSVPEWTLVKAHCGCGSRTALPTAACPPNTRWVVATNGDNLYDRHFVETLLAVPQGYDAVAFDYYSRYQRPTGAAWTGARRG